MITNFHLAPALKISSRAGLVFDVYKQDMLNSLTPPPAKHNAASSPKPQYPTPKQLQTPNPAPTIPATATSPALVPPVLPPVPPLHPATPATAASPKLPHQKLMPTPNSPSSSPKLPRAPGESPDPVRKGLPRPPTPPPLDFSKEDDPLQAFLNNLNPKAAPQEAVAVEEEVAAPLDTFVRFPPPLALC